jgi:hypothetical protein
MTLNGGCLVNLLYPNLGLNAKTSGARRAQAGIL